MEPTPQQSAIFDFADDDRSLVIEARAGCGKTTTAIEFAKHLPEGKSVIFVAFNKSIASELRQRLVGSNADARTLHSVGCATLRQLGGFEIDAKGQKIKEHVNTAIEAAEDEASKKALRDVWGAIKKTVGLAKNLLVTDLEGLVEIIYRYNVLQVEDDIDVRDLAGCAQRAINSSIAETGRIDFDDMICMPAFHNLLPKRYDVVIVDEAQDVNPAQQYLIEKMARPVRNRTSRVVAIGDDRQAIYQFRGAGDGVLGDLAEAFDAYRLPLSVTFRCGKKIVSYVRSIVPDYEAHDSNEDGRIEAVEWDQLDPTPGDFVLSRVNAPLISLAMKWLAERKPVVIAGRDIAGGLESLIKRSKTGTVDELRTWLPQQQRRVRSKYEDDENILRARMDELACLEALIEDHDGSDSLAEVVSDLRRLFADRPSEKLIVLSSVHKAKGLERDRVWLLRDTFRDGHGDTAEDNILYVAATRARSVLVEVIGVKS